VFIRTGGDGAWQLEGSAISRERRRNKREGEQKMKKETCFLTIISSGFCMRPRGRTVTGEKPPARWRAERCRTAAFFPIPPSGHFESPKQLCPAFAMCQAVFCQRALGFFPKKPLFPSLPEGLISRGDAQRWTLHRAFPKPRGGESTGWEKALLVSG